MKRLAPPLLLTWLALLPVQLQAQPGEIYIVANVESSPATLDVDEIRKIFMGNVNRHGLTPVAQSTGSPARVIFNTRVVGLTESRIQAYWAQMRFSGRGTPPAQLSSEAALISHLQNTPQSIGYVTNLAEVPDDLTVMLRLR